MAGYALWGCGGWFWWERRWGVGCAFAGFGFLGIALALATAIVGCLPWDWGRTDDCQQQTDYRQDSQHDGENVSQKYIDAILATVRTWREMNPKITQGVKQSVPVALLTSGEFGGLCRLLDLWGRGEIVKRLYDYGFIKFIGNPGVFIFILLGGFYLLWQQSRPSKQNVVLYTSHGIEIAKKRHPALLLGTVGTVLAILCFGIALIAIHLSTSKTPSTVSTPTTPATSEPLSPLPVHRTRSHAAPKEKEQQTDETSGVSTQSQGAAQPVLLPATEGDTCVSYAATSLIVGGFNAGYRIKDDEMQIPITFASYAQVHNFLYESRRHGGICWPPSTEEDIKNGNDVVVFWRDSMFAIPGLVTTSQFTFLGPACQSFSSLEMQQDDEGGPVDLVDAQPFATAPTVLLVFDSKDKAKRVMKNLTSSGTLCKISLGNDDLNQTHPMVVYQRN